MTIQNKYVNSKLGYPTDTDKEPYKKPSLSGGPMYKESEFGSSPAPTPQQIEGASIFGPSPTPTASASVPAASPTPTQQYGQVGVTPEAAKRESPYGERPGRHGSAGGGGGASGKMIYRPQISQSRISVLKSMLGLPRLK